MMRKALRAWSNLKSAEAKLLGLSAVVWIVILLALKLTSEVVEGDTLAFDRFILLQLRSATDGPGLVMDWLRRFMLDVTTLGNNGTLFMIVVLAVGYLLVIGKGRLGSVLGLATVLGVAASMLLKLVVDRPRPEIVDHLVSVGTSSFPSGHAMNSAVVYLTMAAMLARTQRLRRARIYVLAVGSLLTFLIGVSRIYLGVHWPTDVLVGWSFGASWAFGSVLVGAYLNKQAAIDPLA